MTKIRGVPFLLIVAAALLVGSHHAKAESFRTVPDHNLTPGQARNLSRAQICKTKWGQDARQVTAKMKRDVVAAYHFDASVCPLSTLKGKRVRRFEIDHLIPRSLGGADAVKNLWPQCYEPVRKDKSKQANGAHKKDQLEAKLHRLVCEKGSSDALVTRYQRLIKVNWISLYRQVYGGKSGRKTTEHQPEK